MCAGRSSTRSVVDLHPVDCSIGILETLRAQESEIQAELVLLLNQVSPTLGAQMDAREVLKLDEILELESKMAPNSLCRVKKMQYDFFLTTVAKLENFNAIEVKN